jgi:AbrB family looped-hinge helix DNA binding protein
MRRIVVLRSQGRIVIPKEMRDKLGVKEGDVFMLSTYPSNAEKPTKILMEVLT